jgi:type 1 fimbriae regulatory protein FimB/type 1 fimbriae regulatory protein FimE
LAEVAISTSNRSPLSPVGRSPRLIEAAGKRGRYPFRDRVLLRLVYRHGLRASEAVGMRWSQVDLDAGTLHVARLKGSIDSTHSLDRDEPRDLRKLRQQVTGLYVFETERGSPLSVDALQYIVREAGRVVKLDVEVHPLGSGRFIGIDALSASLPAST